MKKEADHRWAFLFILVLILVPGLHEADQGSDEKMVMAQQWERDEKRGKKDTLLIDLLRRLKQTVDGWLKSINDRIEREDVTQLRMRFLEILRSILEWVKEKIDSWLEASEKEGSEREGPLREIQERLSIAVGSG